MVGGFQWYEILIVLAILVPGFWMAIRGGCCSVGGAYKKHYSKSKDNKKKSK